MLGLVDEFGITLGYSIVAPIIMANGPNGNMSDVELGMLVFRLEND
jgi:hypothetical protein